MTEKRFGPRTVACLAGIAMGAGLVAVPAFADKDGDRGRSEQAHENAPGQQKSRDASDSQPGDGNGSTPETTGAPGAQSSPPGQAKSQERPAEPRRSTKSAKPARTVKPRRQPAEPAQRARAADPVQPAQPAKSAAVTVGSAKRAGARAKAGKTTICHATGSATNPYVTITISDNALPAHARHQDGRDLIPAPAGGCPRPAAAVKGESDVDRRPAATASSSAPAPGAGTVLSFLRSSVDETPAAEAHGLIAEGNAVLLPVPQLRETIAETPSDTRRESGGPVARAGQLPFTGLETAALALFGALLVLLGLLFRELGQGTRTA